MATKQQQRDFVKTVYPAAKRLWQNKASLHPLFTTAQAALERCWRVSGQGNNLFGITIGSSWVGKKQLVQTVEYFSNSDKQFKLPEKVLSVTPVGGGRYKYSVMRYFRVYDALEECLEDHLKLLTRPMYADAWPYRNDPKEYARRIVDTVGAKYATDPDYAKKMATIIDMVDKMVKELNL